MLFYSDTEEGELFAHIRNRGFVCIDVYSPRLGEPKQPDESLIPTDEVTAYTNPYGDVLLEHPRMKKDVLYNTVLQEVVLADWPNLFATCAPGLNPYTEMLRGPVRSDLFHRDSCHASYPDVWLQYDPHSKEISVHVNDEDDDMGPVLFRMKKDRFITAYEVH